MTRFHGGPANGQTLMLQNAPKFLRVTLATERGKVIFDALDEPDDKPLSTERLFAYELRGEVGRVHVNMGSKGGGWYTTAEYHFVANHPLDQEIRRNGDWYAWIAKQGK